MKSNYKKMVDEAVQAASTGVPSDPNTATVTVTLVTTATECYPLAPGQGKQRWGWRHILLTAQQCGNDKATRQVQSQSRRAKQQLRNSGEQEGDGVPLPHPWVRD